VASYSSRIFTIVFIFWAVPGLLNERSLGAYCTAGSSQCDEYVSDVHAGTIHNTGTSCGAGGYADYTAMTTEMEVGESYQITVSNGNAYTGDQCGIWVDWNQDEDFEDADETISVSGGAWDFQAELTVPTGALLGQTRMRIRITYTGSVDSCGTAPFGEVEDYSIEVVAAGTFTIIHESATMGSFGQSSGWVFDSSSIIGSRFHLDQEVDVLTIGGHLLEHTSGTVFGVIISLSGPTAFPTGSPFDPGEVIGSVVFTLPDASMDFRIPLSATLPVGDYALLFGAGQFGASASSVGLMPSDGQTNFPDASYFLWNGSIWGNTSPSPPPRFVVEGMIGTSGEYCSASGACDGVSIGRVEFCSINNGWTGCEGYSDYTNLSTSVERGKGYPSTLSYHIIGAWPQMRVWVDWNQDYDFDDPNEEFTGIMHNDDYAELFSATIKAPPDAVLGNTRMRIRTYRGYDDFLPCGETLSNGEVEDYNIVVAEANEIVISTFPYYEDFTTGFGTWTPSAGGNFDWVWIRQRWMQTSDKHFLLAESGSHYNQTAIFQSPTFDISSLTNPIVRFLWDTYNPSPSTLFLSVSHDNGQSWGNLWTSSGDDGKVNVDLPTNTPQLKLRFRAFMDGDDTEMKYIYVGECTVPEIPPSFFAMPEKTFISWLWEYVSTDNDGYKGYDENDTLMWTVSSGTYVKTEFGLSSNTMYSRKVRAYNYCGEGQPTELITSWTLPESPSVSCDRTANEPTWPPGTLFTFTNNRVFGSGGVDHYHYVWDQNPSYSFTGSEPNWSSGTLQLTEDSIGQHYLHVLSHNGEHNENGTANLGPYVVGIPDPHTSEIQGFKFHDLNGNGTQDTGEPNLSGWKIYIDSNENSQWDDGEPYYITDVNGYYAITNLASGTYTVAEVVQSDWGQTFPGGIGTHPVTVAVGEVAEGFNFGNKLLPGEIHGVKWSDLDANGVQNTGEIGLEGWTIYVDVNENGQWDIGEPYDTTDSSGNYSITDLSPDTYIFAEVNHVGWEQTFPGGAGTHCVSIGANQIIENINFGNYPLPGRIIGTKWHDLNGNGIQDTGEPALQDWTIYLDLNDNGQLDNNEPNTLTNSTGYYEFVDLPVGTYTIAEVRRDGWFQTTPLVKPQSGDILACVGDQLIEYSPSGQINWSVVIPDLNGEYDDRAKDLVVNQNGDIFIYNMDFFGEVFLSKYSRLLDHWEQYEIEGLRFAGIASHGGIAVFNNYIFMTDSSGTGDGKKGIVRFNTLNNEHIRFAENDGFGDLNIGLDGLLYALGGSPDVYIFDPGTCELLKSFNISEATDIGGIAANELGEIFITNWFNGTILKTDNDGNVLNTVDSGYQSLGDIDISKDGTIMSCLMGSEDDKVIFTDESLSTFSSFSTVNHFYLFSAFADMDFSYQIELGLDETVTVDFGNCAKTLPGDSDYDGDIDAFDLAAFCDQWLLSNLSADIALLDGDGVVDFLDWAVFANAWQSTSEPLSTNWNPKCDIAPDVGDGIVDIDDLTVFLSQWLQPGAWSADIAPEPDGDGLVNMLDFAVLAGEWLAGE